MKKESMIQTIFTQENIITIQNICDNPDIPILAKRQDKVIEKLKKFGFKEEGAGTNRIVLSHKDFPDVVAKIAIDRRGIIDNDMEYKLSKIIPAYTAKNYESNGIISISQKLDIMSSFDMSENYDKVMEILNVLKDGFMLNDVSPLTHENWGFDLEGNIKICDYAYLTPLDEIKVNKCRCGGSLVYADDITYLYCTECDKKYTYSDITGGIYDPLVEMGFVNDIIEDENHNNLLEPNEIEDMESHRELRKLGFER